MPTAGTDKEEGSTSTTNKKIDRENENNGPLNSYRDPRRTPLLSRIPFAPTPNLKVGDVKSSTAAGRGRKDITPAYAYKNQATGLLEIRTGVPPSLDMVANEDETVVGLDANDKLCNTKLALYPIALNGGGAGLYRDPREFANGNNVGGVSNNHKTASSRRAPLKSHVRFAWPYENNRENNSAAAKVRGAADRDIETGHLNEVDDDDRTTRTRQSIGSLASAMNPWKIWENVHNEMSRLAELRTNRLEDEASHVTLARQKNKASRVSSVYNDDDFDFALVLAPHEAYAFWACHLDFREEALHLVDDQGPEIEELDGDDASTIATEAVSKSKLDQTIPVGTPKSPTDSSGLRRRRTPTSASNNNISRSAKKTPGSGRRFSNRSPLRRPRTSERVFSQRKSLFDRAMNKFSPPGFSSHQRNTSSAHKISEDVGDSLISPSSGSMRSSTMSPYGQRRRWGNAYDGNKLSSPHLTTPPITSLKQGGGSAHKRKGSGSIFQWRGKGSGTRGDGECHSSTRKKRYRDDEELDAAKDGEDMFFSSPGIPRGIAARVNGLGQFLEALKIGIVVRRHRPKGDTVFVQLFSVDGGDTIQFKFMPEDEAVIALKEQAQRYNGRRRKKKARLSFGEFGSRNRMSYDSETTNQTKLDSSVPLPDYLKAKIDREEDIRKKGGVRNAISKNHLTWQNTFTIEANDIVEIQPASKIDPFSKEGDKLGTSTLRQSSTKYVKSTTFSVIVPSWQGKFVQDCARKLGSSSVDLTENWCDGKHPSYFDSLDIEMATEGEYWMILKGFILLHRDASTGRFAAQRAGGFGSYHRHVDVKSATDDDVKTFIEALPPPKTMIQRLLRHNDDDEPEVSQYDGTAPPSDFFLGFSSPGTQIWSRLRQAGLETQRIYALDTRKVMIKVRCPVDRLQDVAEALKLKLKTKDGDYAPFREDMISQFAPTDDGFVSCEHDVKQVVSLFRSSERQKIIDFIIGSRIRDSGAELGQSTQLGKQIQRRVPLHSHARLEALYSCWVLFWYQSNWDGRDGKSLQVGKANNVTPKEITNGASKEESGSADEHADSSSNKSSSSQNLTPPHWLKRVFVGCFYQPLDSIEEYYGEKVAFYFAWLQHCSFHLLYLSVAGLIVFIVQLTNGFDHWIRPWFSLLVMIWSFVVMVTWRRRSNFLAHQWGTLDYQEEEVARPEFKGTEYHVCPVTNTYIPYYPPWKRWLLMCISIPLTVGFTIATLLVILILYGNRDVMLSHYFATPGESLIPFSFSVKVIGNTAPAAITSVQLNSTTLNDPNFWLIILGFPMLLGIINPLLNFALRRLSLWLNDIENHRTEAEHRTHFIIKVFAFRFVCYFAALYYYSFIGMGGSDQATEQGIIRVASTLFAYLTFAHWWNIFLQVFFPLLLHRWRVYRERLRLRNELRTLEMTELELLPSNEHDMTSDERLELRKQLLNKRLLLEHAQVNIWEEMMLPAHDSFTEYLFAVTQFAYVACFSVVLPITPLIVLINHLLNMRLDAFKICRGRRRPLSQKTGGIGVWSHVLHIVTVIGILTNCSLMALTSSSFSDLRKESSMGLLGVFALAIGWEHLMLLLKYILQLTVSTMPASVDNEIKKKKYDQERKRYLTLRAKKERRSGSVSRSSITPRLDNDDTADNASTSLKKSPCPMIRESSAEESHSSHSSHEMVKPLHKSPTHDEVVLNDTAAKSKPKRRVVNVRATKCHSPLDRNNGLNLSGNSRQKLQQSNSRSQIASSTRTNRLEENNHPNHFDEAISKLPQQPSSASRYPLQTKRQYGSNDDMNYKSMSQHSNLKQSGATPPSSNARVYGYGSSNNHISRHQEQYIDDNDDDVEEEAEDIISPSSSLSTVPHMPTPRNLDLDNDDESLYTIEDDDKFATPGDGGGTSFYQGASAPPLSVSSKQRAYGGRTTSTSSSGAYFSGLEEAYENDEDDDDGPRSKWGVHHILQYTRSERSLSLSEQKKSR